MPLQLFFHVYFRMSRIGREYIPRRGPAIIAANHRSFFDPFIIACMARRPMYYVAKRELFEIHPLISWLLTALGAFPVDRGSGDRDTIATAKRIRPHKVRVRAGRALRFPHVDVSTPAAAGMVTERVWACVKLQWAWLGGAVEPEPAPVRETVRAA